MDIKVAGYGAILKSIKELPKKVAKQTDEIFQKVSLEFVDRATNDAPLNDGILRGGIVAARSENMIWTIVSHAPYSAFVEFGTRSKVRIPADFASYASQFKGGNAGSGGGGFFESILSWVKEKGIAGRFSVKTHKKLNSKADQEREYQAAYAIYISILKHGSNPHPFFLKQIPWAKTQLEKELKLLTNKLK